MRITLDLVRQTLRDALGRDSFVASFVKTVEESGAISTAAISAGGVLSYNPAFTGKYVSDRTDLFCLVMHEVMHPLFGHFVHADGRLENIAADLVINACVSILYAGPSGSGSLFAKVYEPRGVGGLLRPMSRMRDSRYCRLYDTFYGFGVHGSKLSTGEVIQSLKILTPMGEATGIMLLGSHGAGKGDTGNGRNIGGFSADVLSEIANDLRMSAQHGGGRRAGCAEGLYGLFIEILKSHLSVRKALLQRFTTQRKVDRFRESVHRPSLGVSPIPLNPSKRDFVLLAAGIPPFHYHNRTNRVVQKERGLAVYLDVSGSVNDHLPEIIGILQSLRNELTTLFQFSNAVVETPFKALLRGEIQTTYGTDFDCVADSIIEHGYDKAVILTDGYAYMDGEKQTALKKRGLRALTILFGGKGDCDEFAPFGDVVQLADITE